MINKNPDDSVRDEQFGADEKASVPEEPTQAEKAHENDSPPEDEKTEPLASEIIQDEENKPVEDDTEGLISADNPESDIHKEPEHTHDSIPDQVPDHKHPRETEKEYDDIELPPVDYSDFTKNELVETLGLIIENRLPSEIRNDIERIKAFFYRKLKLEADERKTKFLEDGGKIEDYRILVDPDEVKVKHLLEKYREKKTDLSKIHEAEKFDNLKKKYDIIDKIKELVNREESINKTFHDFRQLQNEWHAVGIVPQSALKDLWETYHHSVELFYDYIKINKELRDLDLKKNLEAKILLCEKAEELLLEPNPVNAFRLLQEYHNQWREIGPVPAESKNEIWERFKEATSQNNKRHHEYFEKQKDDQRKNLDAKIALCEEVEAINLFEMNNFKEFEERADKVVALQKMWRYPGFCT